MFIAQYAPGYCSLSRAFDTEDEAVRWLEGKLRASGTALGVHGVVFERDDIEGGAA